jgi:hypothetical protein
MQVLEIAYSEIAKEKIALAKELGIFIDES